MFLVSPGVYAFGLFTTIIFANAGQVVTGNQTPHFLSVCRPNYTALGCQSTMQYIAERRACTGNTLIVMSARKSFPSKDSALSVYCAVYTVVGRKSFFRVPNIQVYVTQIEGINRLLSSHSDITVHRCTLRWCSRPKAHDLPSQLLASPFSVWPCWWAWSE